MGSEGDNFHEPKGSEYLLKGAGVLVTHLWTHVITKSVEKLETPKTMVGIRHIQKEQKSSP